MINRSTDVKYAISRDKTDDKDLKAWLSDDSETSPLLLNIPQEIWSVVIPELHKKESIWDLIPENHKSFADFLELIEYYFREIKRIYLKTIK